MSDIKLPNIFSFHTFNEGDKVLVINGESDEEKAFIGSICTILSKVFVAHSVPFAFAADMNNVNSWLAYRFKECPTVGPFHEDWITYPPADKQLNLDNEFDSLFGD